MVAFQRPIYKAALAQIESRLWQRLEIASHPVIIVIPTSTEIEICSCYRPPSLSSFPPSARTYLPSFLRLCRFTLILSGFERRPRNAQQVLSRRTLHPLRLSRTAPRQTNLSSSWTPDPHDKVQKVYTGRLNQIDFDCPIVQGTKSSPMSNNRGTHRTCQSLQRNSRRTQRKRVFQDHSSFPIF
jgi:hypothetical protein